MTRDRDDILEELAREESRLAEAERARGEARARLETLHGELAARLNPAGEAAPAAPRARLSLPLATTVSAPQTSADKVKLFRALFRGRPDLFPIRFVSKTTGKQGYAPECSNKFKPDVCILKNKGKCTDCTNQAFTLVDDQRIQDHLQGRHVMGVYPLLADETCWFLAADFDKRSWQDDVAALTETCREAHVPVAVERSRSGNGAHVWFFFAAPVAANVARRMGCYLLTETMSRRHELGMDSYDRFFPNQDTMPSGGFGNLIALPLQREPRLAGNTVFLDEAFEPFADQWAFLASVRRIEVGAVELIARDASRSGLVIGARFAENVDDDEEKAAPWTRQPSGHLAAKRITGPLPPSVNAVLAQRLFVEKAGLPSALLSQLKRLAAFQNPVFYKHQKMRLSTAQLPRVIACFEDQPLYLALPRGCVAEVEQLLGEHGVKLALSDQRQEGAAISWRFDGQLTPLQRKAATALLRHDTGVFVGPPGIGKTVLGTYLIGERARSTLILVHRKQLLEQWVAQLAMFLGVEEKEIGQIGGGKHKPNGRLDVATIQSLVRKDKVDDIVAGYGQVIVDECHHLPARSFERVLSEVKARYVVGLTGTPQRRDGHHPITAMQLGPVRFKVDAKTQAALRPFEHKLIVRETTFKIAEGASKPAIQDVYRDLIADAARNRLIVDDVIAALHEGRSPILLTERREHLDLLAVALRPVVRHLIILHGGLSAKDRRGAFEQLKSIPGKEERLVLATGKYAGEGFDDARLDTLFLAMPVSWKGTLVQYSGRLHRLHPGKKEVRVYDYVDQQMKMLLGMFEKRLPTYRAIGYARGEAPLGFAEPREERTIVYDEEALRHFEQDG